MSTIIPYFKFYPGEYLAKSISYESNEVQGLFIRACAMYWGNECRMSFDDLSKRLGETNVQKLVNLSFLKKKRNRIHITFLDFQYSELSEKHKLRVEAGRKGGLSNAKAMPEHKEKIRKEDNREDSKFDFDDFYNAYGYKVGKEKAKLSWDKLTESEKELAIKKAPSVNIKHQENRDYQPHPATWLNNKRWEDEAEEIDIRERYRLLTNRGIDRTPDEEREHMKLFTQVKKLERI